jgi:hypothetical protein
MADLGVPLNRCGLILGILRIRAAKSLPGMCVAMADCGASGAFTEYAIGAGRGVRLH